MTKLTLAQFKEIYDNGAGLFNIGSDDQIDDKEFEDVNRQRHVTMDLDGLTNTDRALAFDMFVPALRSRVKAAYTEYRATQNETRREQAERNAKKVLEAASSSTQAECLARFNDAKLVVATSSSTRISLVPPKALDQRATYRAMIQELGVSANATLVDDVSRLSAPHERALRKASAYSGDPSALDGEDWMLLRVGGMADDAPTLSGIERGSWYGAEPYDKGVLREMALVIEKMTPLLQTEKVDPDDRDAIIMLLAAVELGLQRMTFYSGGHSVTECGRTTAPFDTQAVHKRYLQLYDTLQKLPAARREDLFQALSAFDPEMFLDKYRVRGRAYLNTHYPQASMGKDNPSPQGRMIGVVMPRIFGLKPLIDA